MVVHPDGKLALLELAKGKPESLVCALLGRGQRVLLIDCFLTGEHHSLFARTERKAGERYFATFNKTDTALRVQDVLTALSYLKTRRDVSAANLLGLGGAGPWCILARSQAKGVGRMAADADRLGLTSESRWQREFYIPGILRAGGLATACALAAPAPMLIYNTGDRFDRALAEAAYRADAASKALCLETGKPDESQLVAWLTGE